MVRSLLSEMRHSSKQEAYQGAQSPLPTSGMIEMHKTLDGMMRLAEGLIFRARWHDETGGSRQGGCSGEGGWGRRRQRVCLCVCMSM